MKSRRYILTNRGQAWVRLTHELENTEVQLQAIEAIPEGQRTPYQKTLLKVIPPRIEKLREAIQQIEGTDD